MARRIPWSFLLGVGFGLGVVAVVARGRRRARRHSVGRLPREPEVVRGAGPTPVEAGLERPVASASPDLIQDRATRSVPRPHPPAAPAPARFEPVVPDAPEEQDPKAEPRPVDPDAAPRASPVPPIVRRHR